MIDTQNSNAKPPMTLSRAFPDAFLLNFSNEYSFAVDANRSANDLSVALTATLKNGVSVSALYAGPLCFDFSESDLGNRTRLEFRGHGEVPVEVMESRDSILWVQQQRLRIATFIAACIYGHHAGGAHAALDGMLFPNLADLFWVQVDRGRIVIDASDRTRLEQSFRRHKSHAKTNIDATALRQGLALADRVLEKRSKSADFVQVLAMAYQAMVLHASQHSSASLALAAVVVETTTSEILWGSGIIRGTEVLLDDVSIKPSLRGSTPKKDARSMNHEGASKMLRDVGVYPRYLWERADALRVARNHLMHRGSEVTQRQSGEALTVVRDVIRLALGDSQFELTAAWMMRL